MHYIVTNWLFDPEAKKITAGGLQRWTRDIAYAVAEHFRDSVTIYQSSPTAFRHNLRDDILVVGIPCRQTFVGRLSMAMWLRQHLKPSDRLLFTSQELALALVDRSRFVAVNHGI